MFFRASKPSKTHTEVIRTPQTIITPKLKHKWFFRIVYLEQLLILAAYFLAVFDHFWICTKYRSSTYYRNLIKEKIIIKMQKLYNPPGNLRTGNKLPMLFLKKTLCMDNLLSTHKTFIERPSSTHKVWALKKLLDKCSILIIHLQKLCTDKSYSEKVIQIKI